MSSGTRLHHKVAPIASQLAAVGNSTRLAIISLVSEEPMELSTLIRKLKCSPALVSHHVSILVSAGWMRKTKFGKVVTYYLSPEAPKKILTFLRKLTIASQ